MIATEVLRFGTPVILSMIASQGHRGAVWKV